MGPASASSTGGGAGRDATGAEPLTHVPARVARMLVTRVGLSPEAIRPGARLVEELGFDSLDRVEVAVATRQEFGVPIDDEEVARLVTVGDLVAWVASCSTARREANE